MNRKRSLSSHLSRRRPETPEFEEALAEILRSSDRVAAIMCAALVEFDLMEAIETRLADDSDKGALFHEASSPFGTFRQKTVAGKALGLFGKKVSDDLDTIRDIRNQFAHALVKLDFSNEHIAAKCDELSHYLNWEMVEGREVNDARLKYENVCLSLSLGLMRKGSDAMKAKSVTLETLVAGVANIIAPSDECGTKDIIDNMLLDKF